MGWIPKQAVIYNQAIEKLEWEEISQCALTGNAVAALCVQSRGGMPSILSRARMMWNYLSRITERGVLIIKNRRIGHIGIATNDVARDVEWYVNALGFEVTGKFQNGNDTVYFLKNDDVIFEIFPSDSRLPNEVSGRIDHYSFASDDIESDYAYCVKNGYKIVTDGIEGIAGFWDNGIRYFKIASPTGEQFEFCQIL